MIISIESIIESITNPQGRFRTLKQIHPITDTDGSPKMVANRVFAEIFIKLDNKDYTLQIPLHAEGEMSRRAKKLSSYLSKIDTPHITKYRFIDSEMVIFDREGNSLFCDVILIETSKARALNSVLCELCNNGKIKELNRLITEFRNMVNWIIQSGISHSKLNSSYIKVDDNGVMEMCGYHHIETKTENITTGFSEILSTALYMKLLCSKPEICHYFDRCGVPNIITLLPSTQNDLLKEVFNSENNLTKALDKLISLDTIDQSELIYSIIENSIQTAASNKPTRIQSLNFDNIEPIKEEMQCVELDGKFGFIDTDGSVVIDLKYDAASSFSEGRAIVVVDNNFGMIDKTGTEILSLIYESVDWYCEDGVAKIVLDGKAGLVDRNAQVIVPLIYDWMGEISDNLICVKRDELYGYIDCKGEIIIEITFDDATSFYDGVAEVISNGNRLYIDTNGLTVPEAQ